MSELINLLRKNGNETPENIAKILNKSLEDVKNEINELEQKGIIKAYQAIINEEMLDQSLVTTVIEVKVIPENEGGIHRKAQRIRKACYR